MVALIKNKRKNIYEELEKIERSQNRNLCSPELHIVGSFLLVPAQSITCK